MFTMDVKQQYNNTTTLDWLETGVDCIITFKYIGWMFYSVWILIFDLFLFFISALYRATINITSVTYSAEIAAAGRDIQSLTIVRDLEAALQKLLDTLPGLIRVRIVSLRWVFCFTKKNYQQQHQKCTKQQQQGVGPLNCWSKHL